jgi:hypothetical protein
MESGQLTVSNVAGKPVFIGNYKPGTLLDCGVWATGWYNVILTTGKQQLSGWVFVN